MNEPNIVVHDKLEPPIARRLSHSDLFWGRYCFYDTNDHTVHILSQKLINQASTLYDKVYLEKLRSNKFYRLGLVSPKKFFACFFGVTGVLVFIQNLFDLWNISVLTKLVGTILLIVLFSPVLYAASRGIPRD